MPSLRLAFRTLARTPFVTTIAVLSLALGIGANAAIYSLFNAILARPLPVFAPERLINLSSPGPTAGGRSCTEAGGCDEVFSYPMFRDLASANTAFSGLAAHVLFGAGVAISGTTPVSGDGVCVSGSYFSVLNLRPALGRLLTPADDDAIGTHYVAVLSYGYWEKQLGANSSVIGSSVTINGHLMTVVGVAPKGFSGTTLGSSPLVFVPLSMRAVVSGGARGFYQRNTYWLYLFGRLRPGATVEQASASLNTVYHSIINDVEAPLQQGMSAETMAQFKTKQVVLTDGSKGQSVAIMEARRPVILLFVIAATLLLIACANIANLFLARAANRTTEMAVRLSLGATRGQLIAQMLAESMLLAILGGAASVLVAFWTLGGIASMLTLELPSPLHLDAKTTALIAALSLGTGLLFAVAPALQHNSAELVVKLRNNSANLSAGRRAARFRAALMTTQIALSMALLISAGLFIKSLRNVSRIDLGVRPANVVTFAISPMRAGYDTTRAWALYDRVEETLRSTPGVTGVTESVVRLLANTDWGQAVSVEGFKKEPDTDANSSFNAVGANYLHALGTTLLSGRDFTSADNASSMKVAIVNEAFARHFNLGRNAVGRHMSTGSDSLDITIVGVARDWKYSRVKGATPPVFLRPYRQAGGRSPTMSFYIRSALPSEQILRIVPAMMRTLDPSLSVEDLKTLPQQIEEDVYVDRMISILSAAFATAATLLAAIGLYGVLAYSVVQRTREIGVRMALGANSLRIQRMVFDQVVTMTLAGGVLGIASAISVTRAARSLLFEVDGYDPAVVVGAGLLLGLVAFAAGFIPARRASRIDPMSALNYE